MKLGDCSMVSITACAPARNVFSALKIAWYDATSSASSGLRKARRPKVSDELRAAGGIVFGSGLARNQAARIAAAECVGGQPFRGAAVSVGQNRRDRQRLDIGS